MSIYSYTSKKQGKLYGIRFVSLDEGIRKNLRGFKTKKEAQAAEYKYQQQAEYRIALLKNAKKESPSLVFTELFDLYRTNYLMTLAPSTMYDYIKLYERYLLPYFGDREISSINRKCVTAWQDTLPNTLSSKYRRKIRSFLSSVFTFAVHRDFIQNNPVENVVPIRKTDSKKEIVFWTKEEFDEFSSVVDDPLYHALFFFLYNTGCRKGEAFALRWEDLDFENNTVSISKNFTKKGHIMATSVGKKLEEHTKNRKTGKIIVPQSLMDELSLLPKGEYVFGGDTVLSENTVRRRLNHYIALSGVKKIHVHSLRHSCAALMISTSGGGIDTLYAVAERLRDSVDQVLKTYGHLFPNKNQSITNAFNSLF